MIYALINENKEQIAAYSSADVPPFNAIALPKDKVRSGRWKFLCPVCKCDSFETVSNALCECVNCGKQIVFTWGQVN